LVSCRVIISKLAVGARLLAGASGDADALEQLQARQRTHIQGADCRDSCPACT
jgi:hypothetical protein